MKKIMTIALITIATLVVLVLTFMAYNRIMPISLGMHKPVFQVNNVALGGYDVTTYFKGALEKGEPAYSTEAYEVNWYFSSQANMNEFQGNPEKYLPQFGGYCTKAVSTGFAAPADPTVYTLHNDQLYIFSDAAVKQAFLENPATIIAACDSQWN
ncbi:YHS domain-containing (seleno)protein [uncultured Imperialibacter sp.]|uniref:YHS domain-containing (seleno)protein n=1 Tax=uncultured Imperialibacter sp. TaxID=1672639 RepID=UPI0030DC2F76|tara:strand:- start:375519 stop:375983 length:465 start_codon:yes stop_codon:yes gene_type:complete